MYNADVRMVYEDLLSMGLSTRNVEKYVRLVLEILTKVKVGRLLKVTFSQYMLLEPAGLTRIHVATKLLDSKENPLTLYSDSTSKHGSFLWRKYFCLTKRCWCGRWTEPAGII